MDDPLDNEKVATWDNSPCPYPVGFGDKQTPEHVNGVMTKSSHRRDPDRPRVVERYELL
jgi:hypothetical protein